MRTGRKHRQAANRLAPYLTETLEQRTLLTALPVLLPSHYPGATTQSAYVPAAPATVNQAPTDITFSSTTKPGSQWVADARGTLFAVDPDLADTFTYSLVSGPGSRDNAYFTITGNTLCLGPVIPFSPNAGFSIRVRATDAGGLWVEKVITLDRSAPTSQVGHWGGAVRAVAVDGTLGYIAQGQDLVVVDLSDSQRLRELGRAMLPDLVQGLAIAGQYAYVTASDWGLQVIDISDPAHPLRVAGLDLPAATSEISIAGNYAYVAGGFQGAQIVDISNPAAPVLIGAFGPRAVPGPNGIISIDGTVDTIVVAGSYAYTAGSFSELQVFDITNPAAPVLTGRCDTAADAKDLAVAGNYLYAATGASGLTIIDITNPAAPAYVTWLGALDNIQRITVAGGYAYIARGMDGLQILDIRNPAAPIEAGHYLTFGSASAVAVSGSHAYVADGMLGLQVIDVATPSAPSAAGRLGGLATVHTLAIAGNYAYIGSYAGGVQILDISDPAAPRQVGGISTVGPVSAIALLGGYAYLAEGFMGLEILDLRNPAAPISLSRSQTDGTVWDLSVEGNYLYITSGNSRLHIFDATNPAAPASVGWVDAPGSVRELAIVGNYAYLADATQGLRIVDVSSPSAPLYVAAYAAATPVRGLTAADNYLYFIGGPYSTGGRIEILDLGNPIAPVRVSETAVGGSSITVAGDRAFVTADHAFQVLDIANPAAPVSVDGWSLTRPGEILHYGTGSHRAVVAGGYLYVADGDNGLAIFDASAYVNRAPTDLVLSPTAISENRLPWTTIGTFATTDVNADDAFTYSLVTGPGDTDNASFSISDNTLEVMAGSSHEAGSSYSIRVRTTDRDGLWFEKALTIYVTDPDTLAPAVTSVSINGGAVQRSMVRQLSIVFSEPVLLSAGAVQVKLSDGTLPPSTTVGVSNPTGDQRTYLVTFFGTGVIGGSLPDGVYDLVLSSTAIQDLSGNPLTADYTTRFHRLFGDSDGNKVVNALDYARLKNTFGRPSYDLLFNSAFDYEGNNLINALDLARFRQRYGLVYSY